MIVNDYAGCLDKHIAREFFASKRAPTGGHAGHCDRSHAERGNDLRRRISAHHPRLISNIPLKKIFKPFWTGPSSVWHSSCYSPDQAALARAPQKQLDEGSLNG
jgi:hypothetical protein